MEQIDKLIKDTGCCDEQEHLMEISISVSIDGEMVENGVALSFESAQELLGKMERRASERGNADLEDNF